MRKKGYSDLSITMAAFFMKCSGLWLTDNYVEERRRKVLLIYAIWTTLFAASVELRDLYFCRDDLDLFIYVLCNNLCLSIVTLKLYVLVAHKVEFINLLLYMRDNFWNGKYDDHEKAIIVNCKNICIFFTSITTLTGQSAMVTYAVTPFFANVGRNESDRVLPFNMWTSLLSMSPYYEIVFVIQVITLYHIGVNYYCVDNTFCIMCMHLATQFRILQYRFTKLCDVAQETSEKVAKWSSTANTSESYQKFRNCVQQHQILINYFERLEKVFTLIIFGQVLVFNVVICLFGYQLLLAELSTARRSTYVFTLSGSTFLLYMFAYSCHSLTEESENISSAVYSSKWMQMPMDEGGKMLRNDLRMVILRARRACYMTANGFFPVSSETFTTILSTAASYFTLLRNTMEDAS